MNRLLLLLCAFLCSCGTFEGSGSPGSGGSTPSSGDECVDAHEKILSDLTAIARDHASGCSIDSDCGLLELSISCQEACATPVLATQLKTARDQVAAYAARVCPDAPTSCAVSSFCAPTEAACVDGICSPRF